MTERLSPLSETIYGRYARISIGIDPKTEEPIWANPEANTRPLWLWRMAQYYECAERDTSQSEFSFLSQLSRPWEMLTESPTFNRLEDIDQFEAFQKTFYNFGFIGGYLRKEKDGIRSSAEVYVEDVAELLSLGVEPKTIAGWFDRVGGWILTDPAFASQLISAKDALRYIPAIEGSNWDNIWSDVLGEAGLEQQYMRRERYFWHKDSKSAVDEILHFSKSVPDQIKKYLEENPKLAAKWGKELNIIGESATNLSILFTEMEKVDYANLDVLRPSPIHSVIVPTAIGLADVYAQHNGSRNVREVARKLVGSVMRKRRMGVDREDILNFCAAFRLREGFRKRQIGQETEDVETVKSENIGVGIDLIKKFLRDEGDLKQIIKSVSKELVPAILLELQIRRRTSFEITREDYGALGLGHRVYERHRRIVEKEREVETKGLEVIKPGDAVVLAFGQYEYPHDPHILVPEEVTEISIEELIYCGILPTDFIGKLYVVMAPNQGSPERLGEKDPDVRRDMIKDSIKGTKILVPSAEDDTYGPTATRMQEYEKRLKDKGVEPVIIIRLTGTHHLDLNIGAYTKDTEMVEWEYLNEQRHIFNMHDLSNFFSLAEWMRSIKTSFPRSRIVLGPLTEVHTTDAINLYKKGEIGRRTLLSIFHPDIVPIFEEYEGLPNGNEA